MSHLSHRRSSLFLIWASFCCYSDRKCCSSLFTFQGLCSPFFELRRWVRDLKGLEVLPSLLEHSSSNWSFARSILHLRPPSFRVPAPWGGLSMGWVLRKRWPMDILCVCVCVFLLMSCFFSLSLFWGLCCSSNPFLSHLTYKIGENKSHWSCLWPMIQTGWEGGSTYSKFCHKPRLIWEDFNRMNSHSWWHLLRIVLIFDTHSLILITTWGTVYRWGS